MSGRRAEAARNDTRILDAARAVFVADPGSPISAVAERAGVGISALYRRYPSKEDLLRTLCGNGLRVYLDAVEAAVDDSAGEGTDVWAAFAQFMARVVDADTHSLTQRLAGTFTPTEELFRDSERAQHLNQVLVDRAKQAGVLRPDIDVNDLSFIFEQLSAVRLGDEERTRALRKRYLTLFLQALRAETASASATPLPGPPPTWQEIGERWAPH
jgi:AcrR family transcriptional regulator